MAAAVRASVRLSSRCVASVSRPTSLAACAARVATRGCSARSRPCFTPLVSLNRRCANVVMSGNESSSSEVAAFPVRRFSAAAAAAAAAQQGVLVVADHNNHHLSQGTLAALTMAKQLGAEVTVLVAGNNCSGVADQVSQLNGVKEVLLAQDPALEHHIAENMTNLILKLQSERSFSHIVSTATAFGKDFLPRVAVYLDVAVIGDVVGVKAPDTFVRPIYAGNAICTVQSVDKVKVITVRSTAFDKATASANKAVVSTYEAKGCDAGLTTWVKDELSKSDRPDLSSAKVVVAGGRGMKSGENFSLLYTLADALGGAVGASRAAVDAGFVPNDLQVGQTGKVVAPNLYIAVGISGAIQHLAGMKDSKYIVAINKDPEAPIFQVSDFGLVADLFKAVPELSSAVGK